MIAAQATRHQTAWPVSFATPTLDALPTAPGLARAYVKTTLTAWSLSHFVEMGELIVTELVTNSV